MIACRRFTASTVLLECLKLLLFFLGGGGEGNGGGSRLSGKR